MKLVAAVIGGVVVGFVVAWLVFAWPTGSNRLSKSTVESRLLRQERAQGRPADDASCAERQATGGHEYLCQVVYGLTGDQASDIRSFVATLDGQSVSFTARPR